MGAGLDPAEPGRRIGFQPFFFWGSNDSALFKYFQKNLKPQSILGHTQSAELQIGLFQTKQGLALNFSRSSRAE